LFYINKEFKKSLIIDYYYIYISEIIQDFFIFNCPIDIIYDTINVFKEKKFQIDRKIRKYKLNLTVTNLHMLK